MDKLLEQVAQTLKIPTDALQTIINNYPQIRHEYAIYKALGYIGFAVGFLVMLNTIVTALAALTVFADIDERQENEEYDHDKHKRNRKIFYISIVTLVLGIGVIIACCIASAFMAPDVHIIKDLLGR